MSKSVVLQIARTEKCGWEQAKGFRPGVSQGCVEAGEPRVPASVSTALLVSRRSSERPPTSNARTADGRPAGNIPRSRVPWPTAGRFALLPIHTKSASLQLCTAGGHHQTSLGVFSSGMHDVLSLFNKLSHRAAQSWKIPLPQPSTGLWGDRANGRQVGQGGPSTNATCNECLTQMWAATPQAVMAHCVHSASDLIDLLLAASGVLFPCQRSQHHGEGDGQPGPKITR